MRKILSELMRTTAIIVVFTFGVFLVAAKVLDGYSAQTTDRDGKSVLPIPSPITERQDEITNYVLFTNVRFDDFEVVTGTEYGSSDHPEISRQWCYLSEIDSPNGVTARLSLAEANAAGAIAASTFSAPALRQFGLDDRAANALIESHCRFQ